jgi:hypothetical protein
MFSKKVLKAWRPPADAPIPTVSSGLADRFETRGVVTRSAARASPLAFWEGSLRFPACFFGVTRANLFEYEGIETREACKAQGFAQGQRVTKLANSLTLTK